MDTRSKILFAAFILAGLLSASVLYVSEQPGLAEMFVRQDIVRYGELYNMCRVRGFGERLAEPPVPLSERPPEHGVNEADVIILGNSFVLDIYYGWSFGTVLERESGLSTFSYQTSRAGKHMSPAEILDKLGLGSGSPLKYVVLLHTERFRKNQAFHDMAMRELREYGRRTGTAAEPSGRAYDAGLPGSGPFGRFRDILIDKDNLEFLVTENPYIHEALVRRNTFRFRAFGEMDGKTPVYSTDPPMLHYYLDIAANRSAVEDGYFDDVADYMKLQGDLIEKRYGAKAVVMLVPSKYTLCGYDYERYDYNVEEGVYDGFIPRLEAKLAERGVMYLDLYGPYQGRAEEIYEPHHMHWNFEGMEIAAKGFMKLTGTE